MNQFKLLYDKDKKIWFVAYDYSKEHIPKISINHLVNPNNREKWLHKNSKLHIQMEKWLKNEHPEFFI